MHYSIKKRFTKITTLLLFIIIYSNNCNAEIYKCINKNGKIKYQSRVCDDNDISEQFKVPSAFKQNNYVPTKKKTYKIKTNDFSEQKTLTSNEAINIDKKRERSKRCAKLKKEIKTIDINSVKNCKKNYNNYCNKSPAEIDRIMSRQTPGHASIEVKGGIVSGAKTSPRSNLKSKLRQLGCR